MFSTVDPFCFVNLTFSCAANSVHSISKNGRFYHVLVKINRERKSRAHLPQALLSSIVCWSSVIPLDHAGFLKCR